MNSIKILAIVGLSMLSANVNAVIADAKKPTTKTKANSASKKNNETDAEISAELKAKMTKLILSGLKTQQVAEYKAVPVLKANGEMIRMYVMETKNVVDTQPKSLLANVMKYPHTVTSNPEFLIDYCTLNDAPIMPIFKRECTDIATDILTLNSMHLWKYQVHSVMKYFDTIPAIAQPVILAALQKREFINMHTLIYKKRGERILTVRQAYMLAKASIRQKALNAPVDLGDIVEDLPKVNK